MINIQPTLPLEKKPLWRNGHVPCATGTNEFDIPTITPYIPEKKNCSRAAVIVFPGGGYWMLADQHEGKDYAQFFNLHGVTAFVVHYRLGSNGYRHPVMLMDAARAVRHVRANAEEYGINPERIGVMGSSAGGHLAATIMTKYDNGNPDAEDTIDRVSSRPDFGILCYPVITMLKQATHQGSCDCLLGEDAPDSLRMELSAELHVTPQTPKCFIWHTAEDGLVPVENSLLFATSLAKNKIPFSMNILQNGEHGLGLKAQFPYSDALPWATDLIYWMSENGLILPPPLAEDINS